VTPTVHNCTTSVAWRLPFLVVSDEPEFEYRGLMVDAARNEVNPADLQRFVDVCRFYKLNFLHIHLSDDQAFTFPSTAFPTLAAKSAFRYTLADLVSLKKCVTPPPHTHTHTHTHATPPHPTPAPALFGLCAKCALHTTGAQTVDVAAHIPQLHT
jgi:N-acetyl-beta-hexosaminidase